MNFKNTLNMTQGNYRRIIVQFAFPIFLSQLFQQLYNSIDSLIVGNALGETALAAVSSSGSLIFLFVGFFIGVGSGTGVIISKYYGAGNERKVSQTIHNVIILGLICGILMGIIGLIFSPLILELTGTIYQLHISMLKPNIELISEILKIGLPSGIQNSVISIGNVMIQANINSFGKMAMAGCGSYFKVEGFVFLPITAFSMALTTFISQNLGGNQYDRAKKGARFGILSGVIAAEIIGFAMYIFCPAKKR